MKLNFTISFFMLFINLLAAYELHSIDDPINLEVTNSAYKPFAQVDSLYFINPPIDTTVSCNTPVSIFNKPLNFVNTQTGPCSSEGLVYPSLSSFTNICGGTISILWDTTDACGNILTYTQTVNVNPPNPATFINPPSDISIICGDPINHPSLIYTNGETQACEISGSVAPIVGNIPGNCGGNYFVNWNFTDACGRTTTHIQTVTVEANLDFTYELPLNNTLIHCDSIDQMLSLNYSNNQMDICSITGNTLGQIDTSNFECGDTISIVWNIETECGGMITEQRTFITYPRVVSNKKHLPIEYLSFRPNPVTNRLFINLDSFVNDQLEIEIYNLSGKRIKTIGVSDDTFIDVSDLKNGVYLLRVLSKTKIGIARFLKM